MKRAIAYYLLFRQKVLHTEVKGLDRHNLDGAKDFFLNQLAKGRELHRQAEELKRLIKGFGEVGGDEETYEWLVKIMEEIAKIEKICDEYKKAAGRYKGLKNGYAPETAGEAICSVFEEYF